MGRNVTAFTCTQTIGFKEIINFCINKASVLGTHIAHNAVSVNKAKYLGTLLDAKLTCSDHIKALETKVSRSVGILSKLKYFLPQDALLKLYYALIHSLLIMEY